MNGQAELNSGGWKSREPKKADGELTKREYVAVAMMNGLLASLPSQTHRDPDLPSCRQILKLNAQWAVAAADALMRELGDGEQLNASLVRSAKSALNLLERVGVNTSGVSTLAALRDAVTAAEKGNAEREHVDVVAGVRCKECGYTVDLMRVHNNQSYYIQCTVCGKVGPNSHSVDGAMVLWNQQQGGES